MGMPVTVTVRDPAAEPADLDPVFDCLREADALFSPYRRDSAVCRLDRGELALEDADPLVREVLGRCEALRIATDGAFDARATGRLDPSGLVKGWAVDRAAGRLSAESFCIDAGGDVLVRGGPWRVGVRHPRRRDRLAAVLELGAGAVATSATYERGEHVRDPRTGRPPRGVLSVTVTAGDLATADSYATAAFAMGEAGPAWTATLPGAEAMTILAGGRVLSTPGFDAPRTTGVACPA
jgi:thiamine biosynthesis lipoprotein